MKAITLNHKYVLTILLLIIYFTISSNLSYSASTADKVMVTATVQSKCLMRTENVGFGTYDAIDESHSGLSAVGNVNIKCSRGVSAEIKIDSGMHQGRAQGASRAMASADGAAFLGYEIYKDQNKSSAWTDQSYVTYKAASSSAENIPFYANIPANQQVADGHYSDAITVTVIY